MLFGFGLFFVLDDNERVDVVIIVVLVIVVKIGVIVRGVVIIWKSNDWWSSVDGGGISGCSCDGGIGWGVGMSSGGIG